MALPRERRIPMNNGAGREKQAGANPAAPTGPEFPGAAVPLASAARLP